jgi:predicted CopG family antitoxin
MQKKLTITIDKEVYAGLHTVIGRRNISQFIESLVRPHVLNKDLEAAYEEMAKDELREAEAREWIEGTIGEISDETSGSMVGKLRSGQGGGDPKTKTSSDNK